MRFKFSIWKLFIICVTGLAYCALVNGWRLWLGLFLLGLVYLTLSIQFPKSELIEKGNLYIIEVDDEDEEQIASNSEAYKKGKQNMLAYLHWMARNEPGVEEGHPDFVDPDKKVFGGCTNDYSINEMISEVENETETGQSHIRMMARQLLKRPEELKEWMV